MSIWPFKQSAARLEAERLLAAVVAASRQPALYGVGRTPDTMQGRIELMTLHGALALMRLRRAPAGADLAQEFTDLLFRHFDSGLREAGVGDLSVPKKMHRLAGDFYGRLEAYDAALAAGPAALEAALGRNLLATVDNPDVAGLAAYAAAAAARLAAAPLEALASPATWGL